MPGQCVHEDPALHDRRFCVGELVPERASWDQDEKEDRGVEDDPEATLSLSLAS